MIKVQTNKKATKATITFSLPLDEAPEPVSVAGTFNDWDPLVHPLKKRSNGTRSTKVEVDLPAVIEFKYLRDGGVWFNDADAAMSDGDPQNSLIDLTN
ncbi:MAG: isoamylase early set domain-containing protein [Acidimicrobiales bacterium]